MKKVWLFGGIALLAVGVAGAAWLSGAVKLPGGDKPKQAEVALEFVADELVRPVLATMPEVIEFSGPLVAPSTAIVRARARGRLVDLNATEGQRVRAGQPVGRIDIADQASRLAERSAAVESARAALAQAERTKASNERLAEQNFISPLALESSRAAAGAAQAQLAQAQALLETTRVGLRDALLLAPIGGIVAKRHVLPGEQVSPEQPLLTIVDLGKLELAGSVGTHLVSRLSAGLPVQVSVEGNAAPVAGRIARIAPAAEPGTRSIGVTVEFGNPAETFRAGQYAVARAVLADETPRLTLPQVAVGSNGGQPHVWVIEDGALGQRAVTLGRSDPQAGRVEVLQGIDAATVVLAARYNELKEGRKARLSGARPAAVAASSLPPAASAPRSE